MIRKLCFVLAMTGLVLAWLALAAQGIAQASPQAAACAYALWWLLHKWNRERMQARFAERLRKENEQ
jgi:Flp pilus assembly protein TadB